MRDQIIQRIHQITAISVADISVQERPRLEYQQNNLYDVRFKDSHWIAKEFVKSDEFTTSPHRELSALQLLKSLDIAPQPIDILPYPDYQHPVVLYNYMQGNMWDRRTPSHQELAQLADTWLLTHTVTHDDLWLSRGWDENAEQRLQRQVKFFEKYIDWAQLHHTAGLAPAKQVQALYQTHADVIQQLLQAKPTLFFSRSDPRFANIIARPDGRIGFVDWEDSGLRSPARTISDLMIHPNQEDLLSPEDWQVFLDVYLDNYPAPDDAIHKWIHWESLVGSMMWFGGLLFFGVRRHQAGTLADWHINGMPANQRLTRYMARSIGWSKGDFDKQLQMLGDLTFFPC